VVDDVDDVEEEDLEDDFRETECRVEDRDVDEVGLLRCVATPTTTSAAGECGIYG
jgi:hypothetical protein